MCELVVVLHAIKFGMCAIMGTHHQKKGDSFGKCISGHFLPVPFIDYDALVGLDDKYTRPSLFNIKFREMD